MQKESGFSLLKHQYKKGLSSWKMEVNEESLEYSKSSEEEVQFEYLKGWVFF